MTIEGNGKMLSKPKWEDDRLYKANISNVFEDKKLKWIPYYTWANRNPGEMMVWIRSAID